ncbi:50S ribosomal protein L4 [Candidatus Kaiserbacteria bacterium]|nr:50S ribosomal protein L4 [Candidatus Kaiserbacteria bacterium]
MESTIYNAQGKKAGTIALPDNIFGLPWNASLMHQVVTSMHDNARTNVAHARGRGEVRGGGKKPHPQKGTGRARAGSSRSPIWKGGGVTHGPNKNEVFSRRIPRSMRAKALMLALSRKFKNGELVFVDSFGIDAPKTALAKKALAALSKVKGMEKLETKPKNAALIALSDPTPATEKSFRNIGSVACVAVRNLNPLMILGNTYLIFENPEAAVAILSTRAAKLGGGNVKDAADAKPKLKKSSPKKLEARS